jgi:hypothetical protein
MLLQSVIPVNLRQAEAIVAASLRQSASDLVKITVQASFSLNSIFKSAESSDESSCGTCGESTGILAKTYTPDVSSFGCIDWISCERFDFPADAVNILVQSNEEYKHT